MVKLTKKSLNFKSFTTLSFSLLLTLAVQVGTVQAQQACDPQFMDAIEARGFAEASRENAQNQNLIFKPDGVFEYSCFRNHAPLPQRNARQLFRESSLTYPTTNAVQQYTYTNFGDIYLNGRYTDPDPPLTAPPADMCNAIAAIWEISRCMNFYNREDLEGFFDLSHYTANDPRQLPPALGACPALPYGSLNMALDIAYNYNRDVWISGPYARNDEDYISDPVDTFVGDAASVDMYTAGECEDAVAIPTGMVVTDYNAPVDSFLEHTCSNPACVYIPSDYNDGECTMP